MKALLLYHPQSETARILEEFAHNFRQQHGHEIELMSMETRDGAATASLYDVMRYPTLIVIKNDGQVQHMWETEQLPPLMNEVAGYLTA
jgi:hypothetical protein